MQISDLADWVRGLDEPSVGAAAERLAGDSLDSFVEMGLGYLSLDRDRPARCPAARHSAPG